MMRKSFCAPDLRRKLIQNGQIGSRSGRTNWELKVTYADIGIIKTILDVGTSVILHNSVHDKMVYVDFWLKMKYLMRHAGRLERGLGRFGYICIPEDCIRTCSHHRRTKFDIDKFSMCSQTNKKFLPTSRLLSVSLRRCVARHKFGFHR